MDDTTPEMKSMQRMIFEKMSLQERFRIGTEFIDFGRRLVTSSIKKENPGISELELKIAILKRYYGNIFTEEEFGQIIKSLAEYCKKYSKV